MITGLRLHNFKGFHDHEIEFREFSVVVGRNNAGKSSAIEALRIVSTLAKNFQSTRSFAKKTLTNRPPWLTGEGQGFHPALEDVKLKPETVFHKYHDPPAIVEANYSNGAQLTAFLGPDAMIYAEAKAPSGEQVVSHKLALECEFAPICILPQIAPLQDYETTLRKAYVEQCLESHLSSRHFRNQVRYLHQHYDAFRELFQQTWSGVRVSSFDSPNSSYEDELALMLSEDGFVAEASNFGHGLQMWLQIVWFLARTASDCVVVLDEPDVYMHVEQQSNMIDMLRGRFRQCILSTHAIKIIEGCDDSEVLRLHRKLPTSLHGVDQRTYDRRVNEVMAESCRDSLGNREEAPNVTTKPHTAPVVKSVNLTARRFDKAFVHIRDEEIGRAHV